MSHNGTYPKDANGFYILSERDDTYLPEIWGLYAVVMIVLFLRFAVRLRAVGIRGLQWDDFFAGIVVITITMDSWVAETVYPRGTNIEGVYLNSISPLTQPELDQLVEGSKHEIVAWYSYPALVWAVKGTMICFYMRMTVGIARQRLVRLLGWACIVSYIVVFLTVTFGCWPFMNNFQIIPNPGTQCTLKPQNFIVMTVLNVITDAGILMIPLPLLWTLQVPIRQKLIIGILLSSGLFVITAAIIRIVITLSATPSALNVNRWGTRETIVGIVATNVPVLRPMFTKKFWTGMTLTGSSNGGSKGGALVTGTDTNGGLGGRSQNGPSGPYEMAPSVNSRGGGGAHGRDKSLSGSEEYIISKDAGGGGRNKNNNSSVVVQTRYEITEGPRGNGNQAGRNWGQGGYSEATAFGGKGGSPV